MAETEKKFYSVGEFAEAIGYSTDRVYEWVRTGRIQANKVTGKGNWLIPSSELEWLERTGNIKKTLTYDVRLQNHFAELSSIALTIANNLSKYRNTAPNCFRGSDKIGDLVYGGFICVLGEQSIALQRIDRSIALNLLAHLQKEFSELDEVTDWDCLTNNQITEALILRLNQKGYKGSFRGKCPACPR